MTALQRWMDAFEADKLPSSATRAAALGEIDEIVNDCLERIRGAYLVRGQIMAWDRIGRVLHEVHTEADRPTLTPVPETHPTLCSVCGRREARVWDAGEAYCKRCAREEGIVTKGKIT